MSSWRSIAKDSNMLQRWTDKVLVLCYDAGDCTLLYSSSDRFRGNLCLHDTFHSKSQTKFHQNPSNSSRVYYCGETDDHTGRQASTKKMLFAFFKIGP